MSPEVVEGLAYRLIGDLAGTCMALAFLPPKTWRGFLQRAIVSMISGMVFAGYIRDWGGFARNDEGLVAAAAVAAIISWGTMGRLRRLSDNLPIPKAGENRSPAEEREQG